MKKGQVYILAVLIIGFLVFTIMTPSNILHQRVVDDDFEELSKNYQLESSKLLNELLNQAGTNDEIINSTFLNFTVSFTSYSKTKNPNFGLIYAFPYENEIFIGNYADVSLTFETSLTSTPVYLEGCFSRVDTSVSLYGLSISVPDITPSLYTNCIYKTAYPSNGEIDFVIEDIEYHFKLEERRSDIIIVSREDLDEDIKVFISE